jgi:hypothetical protein
MRGFADAEDALRGERHVTVPEIQSANGMPPLTSEAA